MRPNRQTTSASSSRAMMGYNSEDREGGKRCNFMIAHRHCKASIGPLLLLGLCLLPGMESWADGEAEFLAGTSKACPKCSLQQATLKRRDLSGAEFHRARLAQAKFTDADLTEANLNKTDLKYASFVRAKLEGGML